MRQYLLDFFNYNYQANIKLLDTIYTLPQKEEAVKLFSHLILAQDKWLNRITHAKEDSSIHWMFPVIPLEELASRLDMSTPAWLKLIEEKSDEELQQDVIFKRASDGKTMGIKLLDLILQINYHNIHHRAQINTLMSKQGITPPQTDYIFTKLREI